MVELASKWFEEWFLKSPAGVAAQAEAKKSLADQRKALEKKISALEARKEKELPPLADAKKVALKAKLDAERDLKAKEQALGRAVGNAMAAAARIDREIDLAKKQLLEIGDARADWHAAADRLAEMGKSIKLEDEKKLKTIGASYSSPPIHRDVVVRDNSELINNRVRAIGLAADELANLVTTKADYAQDIKALLESIPDHHLASAK